MMLAPSSVEPLRSTTTTSSRPDSANSFWNPCCSASTPETTATVAPMPNTVRSVAERRTSRLRKL